MPGSWTKVHAPREVRSNSYGLYEASSPYTLVPLHSAGQGVPGASKAGAPKLEGTSKI